MKIVDLNLKNNDIKDLNRLGKSRYENLFKVGKNNEFYFYNILKTVRFPENLNSDSFYYKRINSRMPYTAISYQVYNTQDLWWFILLTNNITNPVQVLETGTKLKIIKKEFVNSIIENILKISNA